MRKFLTLGATLLGLSNLVNASPVEVERMEMVSSLKGRDSLEARQAAASCNGVAHGPNRRDCWTAGFTSSTDMYTTWPNTGNIVSANLRIENTTCAPDGSNNRVCMLINGRYPGPTITANWGDTIRVTVRNLLQHNGTSIHWHGFRMLNTTIQDGTNGITECALAPGDLKTYEFQATEYGTTWFHSHFSHQYGDGVVGTFIVNGPATANYDVDLGTLPLTEWYYITAYQAAQRAGAAGPPLSDNILVNGNAKNANGGGKWTNVTIESGKRYRLRLVNTAVDTNMLVNLDNHNFTVISTDFVPVQPYNTSYLIIGIGQRYDVVFTADQAAPNYWFRAVAYSGCQSRSAREGRAVFGYSGRSQTADPTSQPQAGAPTESCADPAATPKIVKSVPSGNFATQAKNLPVAFGPIASLNNTFLWTINGTSQRVDPGKPTIKYVADGNYNFPQPLNVVRVESNDSATWTYWIIQQDPNAPPIAHPIHLHGHDSYILGEGDGVFSVANNFNQLNFANPPRRDVAMLRQQGWLVLAYPTDNPGAWLMHCHIAFHVGMGLSLQFLERKQSIKLPVPGSEWYQNCDRWAAYKAGTTDLYQQDDSGLKKRFPPLVSDMELAALGRERL